MFTILVYALNRVSGAAKVCLKKFRNMYLTFDTGDKLAGGKRRKVQGGKSHDRRQTKLLVTWIETERERERVLLVVLMSCQQKFCPQKFQIKFSIQAVPFHRASKQLLLLLVVPSSRGQETVANICLHVNTSFFTDLCKRQSWSIFLHLTLDCWKETWTKLACLFI